MSLQSDFQEQLQTLSKNELAGLAVVSPAIHFSSFVQILDKGNNLIRPIPNILQIRMSQVYEQCMEWEIPCRMLACKPRQVGCSTFSAHIVYHHEQRFRTTGITIADVADNSKGLMKKIAEYSERDSFPWGNRLRALSDKLEFSNGSEHTIDSAENWKAGISKTRQAFHSSEIGKWPKSGVKEDRRVMASVMPSIAKRPRTLVIAEGTPEGAVGWFYRTWTKEAITLEELAAMREKGIAPGIVWIKVFAAWHEFVEHQHDGQDGRPSLTNQDRVNLTSSLTNTERAGQNRFGWTLEQIAWRRDVISTECGGSEDLFNEYYPSDDVSCWLASGRPRFSMGALTKAEKVADLAVPESGFLTRQAVEDKVHWSRDPSGDVLIWEMPLPDCRYLVTCDPAQGQDQTTGKDPDRHSIFVLRDGYAKEDGTFVLPKTVARVRPPFDGDSDEVASHIMALSSMYGNCIIVLEVMVATAILQILKWHGAPVLRREVFSPREGQKVRQYGFKLNNRDERTFVVEALATAIRQQDIDIMCPHAISECKTFIVNKNGRPEARPGAHDDDVFALAMGYVSLASATAYRTTVRRRREPADRKDWRSISE